MGTVKYSGPVASFHCPTEATIRSLKVHFSPKQEGSGDPSPENVREIVGWDGVTVHNDNRVIIPEEYQKVEYLYIDSNQYIDTQYAPIISPEIRTTMEFISDGDVDYFGFANNTAPSFIVDYNLGSKIWYNRWGATGASNLQPYPDKNIKYNLIFGKNTSINGVVVKTYPDYDWSTNQQTLRIGGGRNFGAQLNIYTLQLYDGSLKFNLIPCRRKSDNKPGMYDTVSGEFFTNQGTGEFICGPDVGETVEYEFGVLGKNKFPAADGTTSDIFLAANTTYTFSATSPSAGYFKGWYEDETDTGLIWINAEADGNKRWKTYTPERNIIKGLFYVGTGMSECQIELGSTATAYEPYDPNKTVYGGWVDLVSGEVCEEWWKITLDGVTTNRKANRDYSTDTHIVGGVVYLIPDGIADKQSMTELFCDNMPILAPSQTVPSVYPYIKTISAGGQYLRIYIDSATNHPELDTAQKRIDFVNEYLSEHPSSVAYKLATPNTYHLAPIAMQTFLAQNNVWSNADYVEVEYDLHETQNILARKQFIVANQPHIVRPAAAPIQSFTTDMVAPLKECRVYFNPVQEGSGDPSPENVREIKGWTNLGIMYKNGLPSEYQAVEYLQSTGTQFITGYFTPPTTGVITLKVVLEPESMTDNYWYCGGRSGSHLFMQVGRYAGTWYKDKDSDIYEVISVTNGIEKIFCSKSSNTSLSYDYLLFGRAWNGSNPYSCKIFQCTLYFNDIPIYNYIPCYRKMDNVAGMYDTVNNIFYTNEGTGTFILGQDIQVLPQPLLFESTSSFDWGFTFGTIYGGYVDLVKGEIVQEYELVEDTWGNIKYSSINSTTGYQYGRLFFNNAVVKAGMSDVSKVSYCNVGKYTWNLTSNATPHFYIDTMGSAETYIAYITLPSTTDDNLLITCVGKLINPIIYSLTPTQLKTLRGTNNIWASNNGGNIEVAFWRH